MSQGTQTSMISSSGQWGTSEDARTVLHSQSRSFYRSLWPVYGSVQVHRSILVQLVPIAGIMTCIVSLGMAEPALAYPVPGAQYYWSFMVEHDD